MNHKTIPGTSLNVSPICYGVPSFGSATKGAEALALLDAFREAGGNFFDTAHCYAFWIPGGDGQSERFIGQYVHDNYRPGEAVIATKGAHPDCGPGYRRPEAYISRELIASDLSQSLERLNRGSVDLYLLHRDDPRMGVDEIVDMVHEQIEAGLIRYAGVSNWRGSRIQEANTYARKAKRHPFVISQVQGSLAEMTHPHARPKSDMVYLEPTELQWHYRTGFPLMCYSSTAGGLFATGKIKGTSFDNPITEARHLRAQQLARQLKATTNQIALAYLLSQPHLTFPITGTLKVDHLREAIAAADIKLTPAQIQWLRDGD